MGYASWATRRRGGPGDGRSETTTSQEAAPRRRLFAFSATRTLRVDKAKAQVDALECRTGAIGRIAPGAAVFLH